MAGNTLNVTSTLMCPHGGSVQIISANVRVKVGTPLRRSRPINFSSRVVRFKFQSTPARFRVLV